MMTDSFDAYLARIGLDAFPGLSLDALAALQVAHLSNVPFENLDIHLGVPIELEPAPVFDKIVRRRRGGYCYELNSTFGSLLEAGGFGVHMVSARVAAGDGVLGPDFDHMALVVRIVGIDAAYLVDVGFGDAFTIPIPLVDGHAQRDRDRDVRVESDADGRWHYDEDRGDGWKSQYVFENAARPLAAFHEMNEWQQHSPESHFTQRTVCSLLMNDGRVTISGDKLITTRHGERTERRLTPTELEHELRDRFGIVLEGVHDLL